MSTDDESTDDEASDPLRRILPEEQTGKVMFTDGEVTYPSTGVMVGGDTAERDVDVAVSSSTQGSKFILDFVFEAPGVGETFYYDPTLSVNDEGGVSSAATDGLRGVAVFVAACAAVATSMW